LGTLFLIISLGLALVNRSPAGSDVESAGRQLAPESGADWWQDAPAEPSVEPPEAVSPADTGPEAAQ
jgi:preprotein translocase subunit SecG